MPDDRSRDDARAERFGRLYVAAVVDVLAELGRHDTCLPAAIAALTPEARVAGPAFPYTYVPSTTRDRDRVHARTIEAYRASPYGSVLVSSPEPFDHAESGNFGELGHAMNAQNGIRGFVINGGVRDSVTLAQTGLGVFCRYRHPRPLLGQWEVGTYGEPVTIGSVTIRPGDWLVGDWDGVVAIPAELVDEVLEGAEHFAAMESTWREALDAAPDPVAAYQELEQQYERSQA